MEWLIQTVLSLLFVAATTAILVVYVDRNYHRFLERRLLFEQRMTIYKQIATTVGRIKEIINFASGDNTVRQWKHDIMHQLNDLRCNAFAWSIFLPDEASNAPIAYADAIAAVLTKLDTLGNEAGNVQTAAEIIAEVAKVEAKAALQLRAVIGKQLQG